MARRMARRTKGGSESPSEFRIQASQFGEYYLDLLQLDALVNGSSLSSIIVGNCKASLDRKTEKIHQKIKWAADKRNISSEEMINELLGRSLSGKESEGGRRQEHEQ